jgi:hypothetical protein
MNENNRAEKQKNLAAKSAPLRWTVFAALCVMLLWSFRNFFDYANLFAQLNGRPMIERGRIGANENRSFLARAGRGAMQKNHRQQVAQLHQMLRQARMAGQDSLIRVIDGRPVEVRSERDLPSRVANSWAWVASAEKDLPPDAKILMNIPESAFYYTASTFWHPRQVEASFVPVSIRDDAQLLEVFRSDLQRLDPKRLDELKARAVNAGFTHLVTRVNGTPTVIALTTPAGGAHP